MNEAEWLEATDPTPMLEFLKGKASDRKLRLLMCGFFRMMCHPNDRRNTVVDIGELCSDGKASPDHLYWAKCFISSNESSDSLKVLTQVTSTNDAYEIIRYLFLSHPSRPAPRVLCLPIRDIIGNPFRPLALDPSWLTSTVLQLAEGIYQDRAFDRLPILADALQDSGSENAEILDHCRQPGEHVRGCWVIDTLLGKA